MKNSDNKKNGDGKRSLTVTVRLEPKLKYLADIAARKQRRTLSSFVEWAVEQSLDRVVLDVGGRDEHDIPVALDRMAEALWHVDESHRFLNLVKHYPELLTHQEQEIFQMLLDSQLLSPAYTRTYNTYIWNNAILEEIIFPVLRSEWDNLLRAYSNEDSSQAAKDWVKKIRTQIEKGEIYSQDIKNGGNKKLTTTNKNSHQGKKNG